MNHLFVFILGALLAMQLTTMPSVDAMDPGCNPGFLAFKGYCYMAVEDNNVTEPEAVGKCDAINSTLASIHSEAEFDFVKDLLVNQYGYFIGLKLIRNPDNDKLISCAFTDGTPFDYGECKINSGKKPWSTGKSPTYEKEPNNYSGKETCVAMTGGGSSGYFDVGCSPGWIGGYICKY